MRHSPVVPGIRPAAPAGEAGRPAAGSAVGADRAGRAGDVPLVAVAHGSRDPRAAATVEALLDEVRRARPGLPVRTAYLDHAAPSLGLALRGLGEAVVLPLLLTEAYHSRVDLPAALNEARARDPRLRVHYGSTLGPHRLMPAALERRLTEAGVAAGDPDTAVVLVSAGSSDARANAVVAGLARAWAARSGWWAVTAAYASAAGPVPEEAVAALRAAGAPRVAVAPYLLAPGHFSDKVRRASLAAGADVVADVLGPAPELAQVLLERYTAALRTPVGAAAS
ncbi:sirohydrochlorin chelatase [Nonomuraea muscovyensis]|uniref:Sirohydrochlorin ferrochelatase n=1 Tax=Nonomuraea muscovyensis TaxID=1124761 RepID=A0A7X0EYJ6_9ACTN|nr:sirohydrochlorin chelatase [Nonomuraea muscovyensis]MBB6349217.1 sirohydrochlorin ferrochelatase [Nonomuraea muscovyensis]MDF2704895.1 sirohydrochlorin chelatase [Nonomuraea muscovyensis]